FFFKKKPAYAIVRGLEFRRVLFRSRFVSRDRRVLGVRNGGDVDERIRPQRRADFVKRHARDGQIGEERRIARDQLAEGAGERNVIGRASCRERGEVAVGGVGLNREG